MLLETSDAKKTVKMNGKPGLHSPVYVQCTHTWSYNHIPSREDAVKGQGAPGIGPMWCCAPVLSGPSRWTKQGQGNLGVG